MGSAVELDRVRADIGHRSAAPVAVYSEAVLDPAELLDRRQRHHHVAGIMLLGSGVFILTTIGVITSALALVPMPLKPLQQPW